MLTIVVTKHLQTTAGSPRIRAIFESPAAMVDPETWCSSRCCEKHGLLSSPLNCPIPGMLVLTRSCQRKMIQPDDVSVILKLTHHLSKEKLATCRSSHSPTPKEQEPSPLLSGHKEDHAHRRRRNLLVHSPDQAMPVLRLKSAPAPDHYNLS